MARVSVIIPTYNRAAYLPEALASVRAQTFKDYEIVVVDDGSTDSTADLLAGDADVRYIACEHAGVAAARNRGVAEAQGEFIAFIDSDDLWLPEKLERQVSYLDAHPDAQLVFCEYKNYFDNPNLADEPAAAALLQVHIQEYLASALIRASVFDAAGCFQEGLAIGEDTEWTQRLQVLKVDLTHKLPEVLYRRRIHGANCMLTYGLGERPSRAEVLAASIRNARRRGTSG